MIFPFSEALAFSTQSHFPSDQEFIRALDHMIQIAYGDTPSALPASHQKCHKRVMNLRDIYFWKSLGLTPRLDHLLAFNGENAIRLWDAFEKTVSIARRRSGDDPIICSFLHWSQNHKELVQQFADCVVNFN